MKKIIRFEFSLHFRWPFSYILSWPFTFYDRKGKLYQTYYDGMEEQLNALELVTNAIIYWNSLYLEKVFEQMKTEGFDCSEEMIRKQSPLISDHINFVGKYSFRYEKELSNGTLRPLNIENY